MENQNNTTQKLQNVFPDTMRDQITGIMVICATIKTSLGVRNPQHSKKRI